MPYVNRGTIFVPRFRKFSNTEHNDAVRFCVENFPLPNIMMPCVSMPKYFPLPNIMMPCVSV